MTRAAIVWLGMLSLPAAAQTCAIGGNVVEDSGGSPIARARVVLKGAYSILKLTDDQGAFCFPSLEPGNYVLSAQKAGFLEAFHGVTITVEAGVAIKPVTLRMARNGRISGKVINSEGEAVPGASVTLWQRAHGAASSESEQADTTAADSAGQFEFAQLDAGTYYLSAKPANWDHNFIVTWLEADGRPAHEKEVETFYSTSLRMADAGPIDVIPGKGVENLVVSIQKIRLRGISGHVDITPPPPFLSYEPESGRDRGDIIPVAKDGSFVKFGIPPGRYTISVNEGRRAWAKDVDLTTADAVGVTLDPVEMADVPVVFHTDKGARFQPLAPNRAGTMLVREGGPDDAAGLQKGEDGAYRFAGVPRGVYRLRLDLLGQPFYVKDVTFGGETLTADKLDLRGSRQGTLEINLSSKVATVKGQATTSGEGSEPDDTQDLTVILVDRESGIAAEAATDQKGRFELRTLAPGKYRIFAIEGFDEDDWTNARSAKALADKSVEIDLKESEKKQVRLKVITAGEWKAAVKKSGG